MSDEWMPLIKLPLTHAQFRQLPRNAAYKYEFLQGQVYLSPRPRHYHALLELKPLPQEGQVEIRPAIKEDAGNLVALFAGVFRHIQPFGSLDDKNRQTAARQALDRAFSGGDGPWIERASFVAVEDQKPIGAVLITLVPPGDGSDWTSYRWENTPPADSIGQRLGRPHLTWIFVSPLRHGRGVGTALLATAVNALHELGFTQLLSTFIAGNDSSMLWHWRNGFQLLPYPGSFRQAFVSGEW
jgi:GNAT superfamily N-acetyltransferase